MASPTFGEIMEIGATKELAERKIAFVESIKCTAAVNTTGSDRYTITFSTHSEDGDNTKFNNP